MSNKKIPKDFMQGEEFPANILPTHTAWKDMEQRLKEELPEKGGVLNKSGRDKPVRGWIIKGIALLLLLLLTWTVIEQVGNKAGTKNISRATTGKTLPVPEEINNKASLDRQNTNAPEKSGAESNDSKTIYPLQPEADLTSKKDNDTTSIINKNTGILVMPGEKAHKVNHGVSVDKKSNNNASKKNKQGIKKLKENSSLEMGSNAGGIINAKSNVTNKALLQNDNKTLPAVTKDSVNRLFSAKNINSTDKKKQDSLTGNNTTAPEVPLKIHTDIQWGVQWALQLPTGSTNKYFRGPGATSQPYRVLFPGLWLNFRIDKSIFTIEINPFASNVLPAKSFGTFTSVTSNIDTVTTTTEIKTLRKTFGVSGSLGYVYNISGNWWFGTSVQGYWWRKGIATTNGEEVKQVIGSSSQSRRTFSNVYSMPGDERNYFTKFQVNNSLELVYKKKIMQGVLRVGVTALPFSKNAGPHNPLRAEFLYRLSLFDWKKPKLKY